MMNEIKNEVLSDKDGTETLEYEVPDAAVMIRNTEKRSR
jgi:hypothetical protein